MRSGTAAVMGAVIGVMGMLAGGCASTGERAAETPASEPLAANAGGAAVTTVASTAAINTTCPIGKHDITEAGGTHRFGDQVVGFCCEGCYDAWPAMSRAERAAKLAAVTPKN